jgi:hypothetical protein
LLRCVTVSSWARKAKKPSVRPNNDLADPADFSNGAKILKEYTDDHDNAEDAGFLSRLLKPS